MNPELESSVVAQESAESKSPIAELRDHLTNTNRERIAEQWPHLISQIHQHGKLAENDRHGQEFHLKYKINPLAIMKADGVLALDERFDTLDSGAQRYVLAHEFSHRLDGQLRHSHAEQVSQIKQLAYKVSALDPESSSNGALRADRISSYVADLAAKHQKAPEMVSQATLEAELMAELYGQYLTSDGSFGGWMSEKLRQFPSDQATANQLTPEQLTGLEDWEDKIAEHGSVANYLNSCTNDDQEAFLASNPALAEQFELYSQIDQLFKQEDLFTQPQNNLDDDDYYDTEELIASYHTPAQYDINTGAAVPTNPKERKGFFDTLRLVFGLAS